MTVALTGKRIVNTRAAHQAKALDALLHLHGAFPLSYPCIDIVPPEDAAALDTALFNLAAGHYDWLTLTSANTVFAIAERLSLLDLPLTSTAFRTAAVGPMTAEAARDLLNLEVVDVPAQYDTENLATFLPIIEDSQILLPESDIARPILADKLAQRGARVTVVTAYQTICGCGGVDIPHLLAQKQVDAITFTSSSTVTYFLERLRKEEGQLDEARGLCAACIGSKTAATARDCGFAVLSIATEHTLEGLIDALDTYFTHATQAGKHS